MSISREYITLWSIQCVLIIISKNLSYTHFIIMEYLRFLFFFTLQLRTLSFFFSFSFSFMCVQILWAWLSALFYSSSSHFSFQYKLLPTHYFIIITINFLYPINNLHIFPLHKFHTWTNLSFLFSAKNLEKINKKKREESWKFTKSL